MKMLMKMKYLQIESVQNLNSMLSNKNLKEGALWGAGKVANDNKKNKRYVHNEAMRTSNSKGKKYDFAKLFPPKRIEEVAYILEHDLKGIEIPKEDERIKYILADPYAPEMKLIKGVYLIYNKTILELLTGKIHSINSYEFKYPKKKNRKISDTDMEYALDMATIVVLASTNNKILTTYFISGFAEKLNSILNVCIGYSKDLEYDEYKASLQNFKKDIEIVSQMGLLEKILGNDSGAS
ncbi:hypothetical protein ACIQWQ_01805 [Peribacillus frigoritolerans]